MIPRILLGAYCETLHFGAPMKVVFPPYVQDYAIETPLKKSSTASDGDFFHQVKIEFNTNSSLAAINFVLKVCLSVARMLIF